MIATADKESGYCVRKLNHNNISFLCIWLFLPLRSADISSYYAIVYPLQFLLQKVLQTKLSRFLIDAFKLKICPLECFPMFVQEAIRLKCFMPTHCENGEHAGTHITLMTFTQFTQNSSVGSMLALCGSITHVDTLQGLRRL